MELYMNSYRMRGINEKRKVKALTLSEAKFGP